MPENVKCQELTPKTGIPDCTTDASGTHTNGALADCALANWNGCNAPCPSTHCYSLVGKIE